MRMRQLMKIARASGSIRSHFNLRLPHHVLSLLEEALLRAKTLRLGEYDDEEGNEEAFAMI